MAVGLIVDEKLPSPGLETLPTRDTMKKGKTSMSTSVGAAHEDGTAGEKIVEEDRKDGINDEGESDVGDDGAATDPREEAGSARFINGVINGINLVDDTAGVKIGAPASEGALHYS